MFGPQTVRPNVKGQNSERFSKFAENFCEFGERSTLCGQNIGQAFSCCQTAL